MMSTPLLSSIYQVAAEIASHELVRRFYRTLVERLNHNSLTVVAHSLLLLARLVLDGPLGEKVS